MNIIKSSIICILILFIGSSLFSQTSDEVIKQAQELYDNGDYQ